MGFRDWNINDLALNLSAVPLSGGGGYADDEVFGLEWGEDVWTTYVGADGEVSRSATNNDTAIATIRYAQTSVMNDRMWGLLTADRALPNGAGAGLFVARDTEGTLVVTSERAWIMGRPAVKLGKTIQVYEWKIQLADASGSFIGGR